MPETLKQEHPDKKDYWENELKSLGIEPRRQNELNDKEELQALAESIKAVYYQDYKTAYIVTVVKKIKIVSIKCGISDRKKLSFNRRSPLSVLA